MHHARPAGDTRQPTPIAPPTPDAPAVPARILLTGATGFLGQAILERLLADHPHTRIDVLLRPTARAGAQDRLQALTQGAAFAAWRARVGPAAAERQIRERVGVLAGALADAPALLATRAPYDLVVHTAGDVSFHATLPEAFATNVDGPRALYDAVSRQGAVRRRRPAAPTGPAAPALPELPPPPVLPHVIHVSTAYVWTNRVAIGPERALDHAVDWRAERACVRRVEATAAGARGRLVAAGLQRARGHGWTDVYTYTKALGERVAEESCASAPLTVLRPTIIESAVQRPYPGWLDGFKVTDPIIVAYAQGRLPAFPGSAELVLDVVPVDVVVNAVLAAARRPPEPGQARYVQVGTSLANPLTLGELRDHVLGYFRDHPHLDARGRPVPAGGFRFVRPEAMARSLRRAATWTARARAVLAGLPKGTPGRARADRRLARTARRLAATREFVSLYEPYACSPTRYHDANLRALDAARPAAERRQEPLDVTAWRWADYFAHGHLPALARLMRGEADQPGQSRPGLSRPGPAACRRHGTSCPEPVARAG